MSSLAIWCERLFGRRFTNENIAFQQAMRDMVLFICLFFFHLSLNIPLSQMRSNQSNKCAIFYPIFMHFFFFRFIVYVLFASFGIVLRATETDRETKRKREKDSFIALPSFNGSLTFQFMLAYCFFIRQSVNNVCIRVCYSFLSIQLIEREARVLSKDYLREYCGRQNG